MARAKKKNSWGKGPVVVRRQGKTFLRKRPKSHRIYIDKPEKALSLKEKARLKRLDRQNIILGNFALPVNESYARTGIKHHADGGDYEGAFRRAQMHAGVDYAVRDKMVSNVAAQDIIRKKGMERQVHRHKDFKTAKIDEGIWGYHVKKRGQKYIIRPQTFFNKRKWQ